MALSGPDPARRDCGVGLLIQSSIGRFWWRVFGTIGVDRKTCLGSFVLLGDTHIPIDHVGRYVWTGPYVTLPRVVLGSDGAPEHFIGSPARVQGTADVNLVLDHPVSQGKTVAWRVAFVVRSYSGKPNLHLTGAVAQGHGGCPSTTTTK